MLEKRQERQRALGISRAESEKSIALSLRALYRDVLTCGLKFGNILLPQVASHQYYQQITVKETSVSAASGKRTRRIT